MSVLPPFNRSHIRVMLGVYAAILLYLSLSPTGGTHAPAFGFGLLLTHAAAYFVLGVLTVHAFPKMLQESRLVVFLYLVFFGFGIELLQTTVPGRFFSWADIGMNTAGAVVVLVEPEMRETVTVA